MTDNLEAITTGGIEAMITAEMEAANYHLDQSIRHESKADDLREELAKRRRAALPPLPDGPLRKDPDLVVLKQVFDTPPAVPPLVAGEAICKDPDGHDYQMLRETALCYIEACTHCNFKRWKATMDGPWRYGNGFPVEPVARRMREDEELEEGEEFVPDPDDVPREISTPQSRRPRFTDGRRVLPLGANDPGDPD